MSVNASNDRVCKSGTELLSARESAVRFEVGVEFLQRTRRNLVERIVTYLRDDLFVDASRRAYDAMAKFHTARPQRKGRGGRQLSEQERLIQKYHQLEQDIVTYENNIGFFSMSKNSEPLIRQMQERIAAAKAELSDLAEQIKVLNAAEDQE